MCSVQFSCSVVTLCDPMDCNMQASLSITNSQSLLKLMSIKLVTPCNHLILCCPLFLMPSIFPSTRVFSSEWVLHIRWPKYWSFNNLQIVACPNMGKFDCPQGFSIWTRIAVYFIVVVQSVNSVWFFATPWAAACQASLSFTLSQTALDFTFMTRHIHNWASFLLWPSRFILSRAIINCPPLFPRSILDTFWLGVGEGAYFLVSHCFAFSYISWGGQEYWSGLPFPPPVDCFLSELFTVTHLFGVALHGIPHSFIELRRPLCNDKVVIPVFHSF